MKKPPKASTSRSQYSEYQQLRYLPQSIRLEEESDPNLIKITTFVICSTVFFFLVWASLTNINEVARAEGEVVPKGFTQLVQHLDGGIISEILTEEGDFVESGQTLLKIDDGASSEDVTAALNNITSLKLLSERIRASVENRKPDFSHIEGASQKMINEQTQIFNSNNDSNNNDKSIISQQLDQKTSELKQLRLRRISSERKLGLVRQEYDINRRLMENGNASKTKMLSIEKQLVAIEGEINEVVPVIARAESSINEYQSRLGGLSSKYKDDSLKQLSDIDSEILQNAEKVKKLQTKAGRLEVKAPVSGIVKGLRVNTIGGVVSPGETLMEIVPVEKNLVVEARINPKDVGHLKIGQQVRLKFNAYDFSRYGALEGKLDFISATTFSDDARTPPFYRGRITLDSTFVGNSKQNKIMPGMIVEADIITGEKTILQYLLKPINNSIKTALTER